MFLPPYFSSRRSKRGDLWLTGSTNNTSQFHVLGTVFGIGPHLHRWESQGVEVNSNYYKIKEGMIFSSGLITNVRYYYRLWTYKNGTPVRHKIHETPTLRNFGVFLGHYVHDNNVVKCLLWGLRVTPLIERVSVHQRHTCTVSSLTTRETMERRNKPIRGPFRKLFRDPRSGTSVATVLLCDPD